MMMSKHNSGGAAAHAGIGYQDRVAAWFAVHILAEKGISIPWDIPSDISLEFILCETDQPVDDLLVGTSAKGHIYIQAKHSLKCGKSEKSDLGSVIDQFVRQFVKNSKGNSNSGCICEGTLNAESDRLVIVTSSRSSEPIRNVLPKILNRFPLVAGQPIEDAAKTLKDHEVLKIITNHIERSWNDIIGMNPDNKDIEAILGLMKIHILDVYENGRDESYAKDILRNYVLKEPHQADSAWHLLINACSQYAILRSGADRKKLQQVLLQKNIELKAPISFDNDIECLKVYQSIPSNI